MNTPHQLIQQLESTDLFSPLVAAGLISVNWVQYKQVFEYYNNEVKRKTLNKELSSRDIRQIRRVAITSTAEEFNLGESTIYQIIKKMT